MASPFSSNSAPPTTEFAMPTTGFGSGSVASRLLRNGFDVNVLKPWVSTRDGHTYIAKMVGNELKAVRIDNANATLLQDEWKIVDSAVIELAKPRMQFWSDMRRTVPRVIPNGISKTVLEYTRVGDITPATISMSPLRRSERDRPEGDRAFLPLPIIHKDLWFDAREVWVSRNGNMPLDTTGLNLATEKVAQEAEKFAMGVAASYSYGGGTVYGATNFPGRNIGVLTSPEAVGWTGEDLIDELLEMKQAAADDGFMGPFKVYWSSGFDKFFGADYSAAKGTDTLQERMGRIPRLELVGSLDYLTGYQVLMVQMTPTVVQAVVGMDITTVQWEVEGGFGMNFKVMAILVPFFKTDMNGNCGVVHYLAA